MFLANMISFFRSPLRAIPTTRDIVPCMVLASTAFIALAGFDRSATARQLQSEPQIEGTSSQPQTIYVPYEKLRDVFEREGRGVFLPYEQFQKLWLEARSNNSAKQPLKPPVDAVLIAANNNASIEREVVVVKSELTVELFGRGWRKIPLQLNDVAIQAAKIDGQHARILFDPSEGYSILIQNGDESATKQIELVYAKAYEKTPGQNSVSLMVPQTPLNQWRIQIPEEGVKVQVEPMLATSQIDATNGKGKTEILAFVGAVPQVRIRWVPKSEGAIGMSALSSVQSQTRILIEEGIVRTTTQLAYAIERAELSSLTVQIPSAQKVVNVFDPNVRKWSVQSNEDSRSPAQTLNIDLFEAARQTQNLVIETELVLDKASDASVRVQPLICTDANRQQGVLGVRVASGLRADNVERKGLMQLDPSELPQAMKAEAWTFAYRYNSVPYESILKITKVLPSIRVQQHTEVVIEPRTIYVDVFALHKIENAGVFQLDYEIPSNYELVQVSGQGRPNVEAAVIDTFRVTEGETNKLQVSLSKRAIGSVGLAIQLRKKIDDPNLVSPTGETSQLSIPVPRPTGDAIRWIEGLISIHGPESLRINPTEKLGVQDNVPPELRKQFPPPRTARHPGAMEVFAFTHALEPVKLSVDIERKRPYATVRQLTHARVEPGFIQFQVTLFTKVQYSSVPSIRIDVPESFAKEIRIETSGVREVTLSPPPVDRDPGYVAWELTSDQPWLGESTIQLTWKQKLEGLEIGKRVNFEVPRLIPRGFDQAWGQVVLHRKESLDLQSTDGTAGLRPIDPRYDLMPGVSHADAVRAFEYQSDWTLKGVVTRYALEKVKQTIIERAFIRAIVTRSNRIGVHAMYRMKNAQQRLAIALPADTEFDSQPLLINGQNVSLERGDAGQLFVPLAGLDASQSLVVELKYTVSGNQERIDLPTFPNSPAAQSTYLGVFMPKERVLIASNGPWTEEFELHNVGGWRAGPINTRSPQDLVAWVNEGMQSPQARDTTTQSDGVFYLYSTTRPEDAPAGSLRLRVIPDPWWATSVIAVLLLAGLILLPASLSWKLVATAFVAACVVMTGVIAPTFASQLSNTPSFIGLGLVALLWSTKSLFGWMNQKAIRPSSKLTSIEQITSSSESPPNDPVSNMETQPGGASNV